MSDSNVFLVPADEPGPKRRSIKRKVLALLERRGIVKGFYDEELGWYAAGPRSSDLFNGLDAGAQAFEYAIIYDRRAAHFVPDSHTGGFGARCGGCGATLDDVLYDLLDEQGEDEDAKDMTNASIVCPGCKQANALTSLSAEVETAVSRFFINFCVVDTFDVAAAVVSELEAIVGAKLRIIPERL
jgi:hypothetical protein